MTGRARRPAIDDLERVEVTSVDELRSWLQVNHQQEQSVWLVTHKKAAGPTYVARDDVLDELLCVGWVDGVRRALDERRTMQLVGPRRNDRWAHSYRQQAARLQAEGRMGQAGLAAIERSKNAGLWDVMADVDALVWPDDLAIALSTTAEAEAHFRDAAPSYQRNVLRWIASAKTNETRQRRIDQVTAASGRGLKLRNL